MRLKTICLLALTLMGGVSSLMAQSLKIGYANIEAILVRMPETQKMNQDLATYEKKLTEDLQSRQAFLQTLYGEYQELIAPYQQAGTQPEGDAAASIRAKEEEIVELEKTLREKQSEAQNKILARRQEKMQPIVEKIQAEIDKIAESDSYDYIFNTIDGSGVSILLHGPEQHDLTIRLMKSLGIEVPENLEAGG